MRFHCRSQRKFQFNFRTCWKLFYNISVFYLLTLSSVSTLTGCTVTIVDIKLRHLQVLCDHEHAKLNRIPKNLKIETKILELSMQNITILEDNSFEEVTNLKKLVIKSSHLKIINRLAFKGLSQLESLNLRNNSLELTELSLPEDSFKCLESLKHLDLSQNPIKFITDFYFKFLGFTLISLTLSDLTGDLFLSTHAFNSLNQLEYLDLTFNKFKTIRKSTLESIVQRSQNLSMTVLLAGNPWNCDCKLRWIREWYYDNPQRISVNLIEEIRPGLRNIVRPTCHSPSHMNNQHLFPTKGSTLSIQEMKCVERSLTNNTYIKVQENSNVTFHCTFIVNSMAYFENRVKWLKNGIEINPKKKVKYQTKSKIDNFKLVSILILFKLKPNDQGKWECRLINEDNYKRLSTIFHLTVKTDELLVLSNRSKKLLIYISVSLLTFLLIIFLIGTSFYFCFRYHKRSSGILLSRNSSKTLKNKDIRPKSVTINPQRNHFLLYDDCHLSNDKLVKHYEPYNSNYVTPCACKDCSATIKKCMHFSGLSIDSDADISIDSKDPKKLSPCPVHGDCNLSITEIVPNIETKKTCPIHGVFSSENLTDLCAEIHQKTNPIKRQCSKKPVILSGKPRNDIALTSINENKNIYLNCPLHGNILSLNHG